MCESIYIYIYISLSLSLSLSPSPLPRSLSLGPGQCQLSTGGRETLGLSISLIVYYTIVILLSYDSYIIVIL